MNTSQIHSTNFQITPAKSHSQTKNSVFLLQKELEDATKMLEIEKRKYMQSEEDYNKVLKQYNEERESFNHLRKSGLNINVKTLPIKTNNLSNQSNRVSIQNEVIIGRINTIKTEIDTARKQRMKHRKMCDQLNNNLVDMEMTIKQTDEQINRIKDSNQILKNQLLLYRDKTLQDVKGFKTGFLSLSQNYFTDRKFLENQIKNSKMQQGQDFQINALPILKQRLRALINRNKDKVRISNEYKKTSGQIRKMFQLMQEFTGKEQIFFIAKEFVEKENNIYKLEEYSSQLENRLQDITKNRQRNRQLQHEVAVTLENQENKVISIKQKQQQTRELQNEVNRIQVQIDKIQQKFANVSPLFQKTLVSLRKSKYNTEKTNPQEIKLNFTLMRSNLMQILGEIQEYIAYVHPPELTNKPIKTYQAVKQDDSIHNSPQHTTAGFSHVQQNELSIKQELLGYDKLKEMATEYVAKKIAFSNAESSKKK